MIKSNDIFFFFFSSRRRHTRFDCDWSSDVCSSDLVVWPPDFLYVHSFHPILFASRSAIIAPDHPVLLSSPVSPFHTGRLLVFLRSRYGWIAAALLASQYLWKDHAICGSQAGRSPVKPFVELSIEDQLVPSK